MGSYPTKLLRALDELSAIYQVSKYQYREIVETWIQHIAVEARAPISTYIEGGSKIIPKVKVRFSPKVIEWIKEQPQRRFR